MAHRSLFRATNTLYDVLETQWERLTRQGVAGGFLISIFTVMLLLIEANRLGIVPEPFALYLPVNHFHAVSIAFTAFLIFEVVGLAFGLVDSVANAAGKQLEIFSLVLLRQSFIELRDLDEPISWTTLEGPVAFILSDATGALIIFGLVGVFYAMQRHAPITRSQADQQQFLQAKKAVALLLLAGIVVIGVTGLWRFVTDGIPIAFFDVVFTLFIFTDVLIVFVSLQYNLNYGVVFRNSGFAVSTVLIRLALAGPPFLNAFVAIAAGGLAIGVTWIYNRFDDELNHPSEVPKRYASDGGVEDAADHA